ncbi:hypothetical protein AMS68_005343 [Peltaster fructicola]|uniref:Uncharacterized protein n=1 Tax=Peltaster fructicola TaxID=286661 RepID=A0A6H0XYR8_9PEZI|nr:hypothetical protein AMS68_005343 [Peltaster fructicola]
MKQSPSWKVMLECARSVVAGASFGTALTAAGVHLPEVVVDQFRLTNFRMFQVFTIALGSSVFIILGLDKLGAAKREVRPAVSIGLFSPYDGNILGGALVGLGMSLTGSCPGTVTAQLAQGTPNAGIIALGGLLGGITHIALGRPSKRRLRTKSRSPPPTIQPQTIQDAIGVTDVTLYTVIGVGWLALLCLSTAVRHEPLWRSAIAGGLWLGSSQLVSILATSTTIGSTGIYDQAGRYVLQFLGSKVEPVSTPPKSLLFGIGAVAGSWILTQILPAYNLTSAADLPWTSALTGGFIMVFGAKIAKGCTSGHGLSGLGALSMSSLVSVASMFGAGILSQHL